MARKKCEEIREFLRTFLTRAYIIAKMIEKFTREIEVIKKKCELSE